MARRRSYLILPFLLALMVGGCQSIANSTGSASPTPSNSPDYRVLVEQAQAAFQAADYAQALDLARQAVAANPEDNTAWELYREASIAQAADDYLSRLPDHRYRLPVERFVRDQVNHTKDWFIVDVREPEEYAAGHIEGAVNIPLRELMRHLDELPDSRTAPILVYCHSQKRATHALVILHELGYLKAYNLQGGYAAYQDWLQHHPLPTPGPTPTPAPEEPDFGC